MKNSILFAICFVGFCSFSTVFANSGDWPCTFQNDDGSQSVTLECSASMNIDNYQCIYNVDEERMDCNNNQGYTSDFEFDPFSSLQIAACVNTGGRDGNIARVVYDPTGNSGSGEVPGLLCGQTSDGPGSSQNHHAKK